MIKHLFALLLMLGCAAALAAIEINQADQAALESVKGIGPGLSGKLIDEREKGPYKDWDDLIDRVSGVGPGSAARLSQAGLTVSGSRYVAPAKADRPAKAKARSAKSSPATSAK